MHHDKYRWCYVDVNSIYMMISIDDVMLMLIVYALW